MTEAGLLVSTRKGLLIGRSARQRTEWEWSDLQWSGWIVDYSVFDARTEKVWCSANHWQWGPRLHYSEDWGQTWTEAATPTFDDGARSVEAVWMIEPGVSSGSIYAGSMPAALFHSADDVYWKNRLVFSNVLTAAKRAGVKNLVHLSGIRMRAGSKDPAFKAFMNAFSAAEEDFLAENGKEGLHTCVVAPANILGVNSLFIAKFISGELKSCPMTDKMPVSFMPVEYLVTALANAEERLATPSARESVAGKIFQLRGEAMSWKTLLALPAWPHKISNTPRFVLNGVIRINRLCAVLLYWAPFGADLSSTVLEIFEAVEEDLPEEEVQQAYEVLGVGPPHPPMAEYVKQLVDQCRAKVDKKKQ